MLAASAVAQPTVTRLEYFVDADPGVGSATPVAVTPSGTVATTLQVPTAGLAPGLHTLHARARRSDGRWGALRSRPFAVNPPEAPPPARLVAAAEVFVDADPGLGAATPVAVSPAGTIAATVQVSTAGLAPGLHTLHARARRSDGRWGALRSRPFTVSTPAPYLPRDVVAVEFFLDADPGAGQGTPLAVTPGPTLRLSTTLPLTGLAEGGHVVGVRTRSAAGRWSAYATRAFVYGAMPAVVPTVPTDDATGVAPAPTLEWAEVGGADTYHLRLAPAATPDEPLIDDSTLAATTAGADLEPLTAYVWEVRARAAGVWGAWSPRWRFTTGTAVAGEDAPPGGPTEFALHAPFPNPLGGAGVLPIDVPEASRVRVSVYDVRGRRVAVAVDEEMPAGAHRVRWSAAGLASGVYVVRMEAGAFAAVRRIAVVR